MRWGRSLTLLEFLFEGPQGGVKDLIAITAHLQDNVISVHCGGFGGEAGKKKREQGRGCSIHATAHIFIKIKGPSQSVF